MVNGHAIHQAHVLLCCVNCILCAATAAILLLTDAVRSLNRNDFIAIQIYLGSSRELHVNDKWQLQITIIARCTCVQDTTTWNDKSASSFELRTLIWM